MMFVLLWAEGRAHLSPPSFLHFSVSRRVVTTAGQQFSVGDRDAIGVHRRD